MSTLDPVLLFDLIEAHVPRELTPNLLIVGSLAAAYHYREQLELKAVNTKDADVIVHPAGATAEAARIAEKLFASGFKPLDRCKPGSSPDNARALSVVRMKPPDSDAYFVELLGFPHADQRERIEWKPYQVNGGWYVLPVFRYMGLTEIEPKTAHNGLKYAAPEMMALSNLLSHPELGDKTIGEPIEGRTLLRSAKDLGRVLALAWLAGPNETEAWAKRWEAALRLKFQAECGELAAHAADGLKALVENPAALDDALWAVTVGLLKGKQVDHEKLKAVALQLRAFALDPLSAAFEAEVRKG